MEGMGVVREKLDIKILLLFILRRLPERVDAETLSELALTDDMVGYFEYAECLGELVEAGHVDAEKGKYSITEKGVSVCDTVESSLPHSVRAKLTKRIEPIAEKMRRRALIKAEHTTGEEGCVVELAMSDGMSNIIELRLLCGGEKNAAAIEEKFRADAEGYYNRIMEMFLNDEGAL